MGIFGEGYIIFKNITRKSTNGTINGSVMENLKQWRQVV
jgi:hypothetical protein